MLYHSLDRLVTVAGGVGTEPSSIFSTSALKPAGLGPDGFSSCLGLSFVRSAAQRRQRCVNGQHCCVFLSTA
jgi:hypothetical protein